MNTKQIFLTLFKKDFFITLIGVTTFFLLGTGIAYYLGNQINGDYFFSGLGLVLFFISSGFFLKEFFDLLDPSIRKKENKNVQQIEVYKNIYLILSLAGLTAGSVLSYTQLVNSIIPIGGLPFLGVIIFFVFLFAAPPFRLAARGYGEFILSVITVNIIPAFAYLLQNNELHPLIPLITFPMTFFYLAMLISTGLKNYFSDMLAGRRTMIIVLDWKLSLDLHDWLILGGFLLIAINSLLGLPWNLVWPMLLSFPVIVLTVFELHRIKNGFKPRWLMLDLSSYSGIIITLYMILFTVWFR